MRSSKQLKKVIVLLLITSCILCDTINYKSTIVSAEAVSDTYEDAFYEEDADDFDVVEEDEEIELAADESVEVSYEITSKWDNHYNLNVTLYNLTGEKIDDWEMCFSFNNKIEHIWNATITKSNENIVFIKNAGWNQDIDAMGSVTFGMTISYDEMIEFPEACYLTRDRIDVPKEDYTIKYVQNSTWDGHVNGQIIITNIGSSTIEDWKLDFETEKSINSIENIWNAELVEICEGKIIQVDNATYNQNIAPGASVEFGFIANCDEGVTIKDDALYKMVNLEYEVPEYPFETNSPEAEDWQPDYDADDFETDEEYEEYLNSIGFVPATTFSLRNAKELYKPLTTLNRELTIKAPSENTSVKALQSFLWTADYNTLFTIFRRNNVNVDNAYLCQSKVKAGALLVDQSNPLLLEKCSHGQTFERFKVNKKSKYMMCAGSGLKDNKATDKVSTGGWAQNIIFLDETKILDRQGKKFKYENEIGKTKRIVGIQKYLRNKTGKNLPLKRIDAALSSDNKHLIIWCAQKNSSSRKILILDMTLIKNQLYSKGKKYINLGSKKNSPVVAYAEDSEMFLQPNGSFQSIELSQVFGKKSNKWYAYITSGNTGKRNQKLVITRFTITKDSNKITNKRKVAVAIPYNKQGTPILNEAYQHEIEGCHIKGDVLQFLLTDSQNQLNKNQKEIQEKKKTDATYSAPNKVVQYIVEMKKSAFKEEAAKY